MKLTVQIQSEYDFNEWSLRQIDLFLIELLLQEEK